MMTATLIRSCAPPARWLCLALLAGTCMARAELVRVANWDLTHDPSRDTPGQEDASILSGAETLRRLNPDIILLQGVQNRAMCERLTEALKPANYSVAICSSFNQPPADAITNVAGLEELKRTYQSRVATAQTELLTVQRRLAARESALGNLGKELLAQGAMDWPEVPAEKVSDYADTARELDKLRAQEHELLRRGYKDAHPLVQTVRALLRDYSSRRAELERSFPTLKYVESYGDLGTNATAPDLVEKLTEIRKLSAQVAASGAALSNVEFEASRIVSVEERIAEVERLRLEQQRAGSRVGEVAILTRRPAGASGAVGWDPRGTASGWGGYAFATIEAGSQRMLCYSLLCGSPAGVGEAIRQVLSRMRADQGQDTGPAIRVVGAGGLAGEIAAPPSAGTAGWAMFTSAGFLDALRDLPAAQRALLGKSEEVNQLFVEATAYPFSPQVVCDPGMDHCLTACDMEVETAKVASALKARSQLQQSARPPAARPSENPAWWRNPLVDGGVAVLALMLVAWLWNARRRRKSLALVPFAGAGKFSETSAYTVVLAPKTLAGREQKQLPAASPPTALVHVETPITTQTQSASWQRRALAAEAASERAQAALRQGLLPELSRWLKQKLVRKLLTDRAELMTVQQAAERRVLAVDQRLARIEEQLQHQNRAYLHRIDELTAELKAAKEENRELIRARIAQVKLEMEAARAKLMKAEETGAPAEE